METRRISTRTGMISYHGDFIGISTALGNWNVGLSPREDGHVEVWFGKLLLGHIDPKTAAFRPVRVLIRHPGGSPEASFWPSPLRSEAQKDALSSIEPQH